VTPHPPPAVAYHTLRPQWPTAPLRPQWPYRAPSPAVAYRANCAFGLTLMMLFVIRWRVACRCSVPVCHRHRTVLSRWHTGPLDRRRGDTGPKRECPGGTQGPLPVRAISRIWRKSRSNANADRPYRASLPAAQPWTMIMGRNWRYSPPMTHDHGEVSCAGAVCATEPEDFVPNVNYASYKYMKSLPKRQVFASEAGSWT
jgi:hypothetical protein